MILYCSLRCVSVRGVCALVIVGTYVVSNILTSHGYDLKPNPNPWIVPQKRVFGTKELEPGSQKRKPQPATKRG
jgi:hypothetical protein